MGLEQSSWTPFPQGHQKEFWKRRRMIVGVREILKIYEI